jgi:hypothetical protein
LHGDEPEPDERLPARELASQMQQQERAEQHRSREREGVYDHCQLRWHATVKEPPAGGHRQNREHYEEPRIAPNRQVESKARQFSIQRPRHEERRQQHHLGRERDHRRDGDLRAWVGQEAPGDAVVERGEPVVCEPDHADRRRPAERAAALGARRLPRSEGQPQHPRGEDQAKRIHVVRSREHERGVERRGGERPPRRQRAARACARMRGEDDDRHGNDAGDASAVCGQPAVEPSPR